MNPFIDGRQEYSRPSGRFLIFALATILAVGGLTTRLFYLQIVNGGQFATLSEGNRTAVEAIPSARGLIYDRKGVALVTNVPTFAVKIRPVDLPEERRDDVVARLAARLIAEAGDALPGVEVVVEARRQYPEGPLVSQLLGYTGPVGPDQLADLKAKGYLPDDLLGKSGIEAEYETQLRGAYGSKTVEKDAAGRKIQDLQTASQAVSGDSLTLTIDTHEQLLAQKALQWGMRAAGLKRGVVIVENPQTGEILAMVSLPTYDDNAFARGISNKAYAKLLADPNKPLLNHAVQAHYPPGSTYKLVTGTGALTDHKISPTTRVTTKPYLLLGKTKFWEWNHRGWGPITIHEGFAHSSDTFF